MRYLCCDNDECSLLMTERYPDPANGEKDYCSKECYEAHYPNFKDTLVTEKRHEPSFIEEWQAGGEGD